MQGEADRQREPLDVEAVAGHLLVAGSMFAFLADYRSRLLSAEMFADLFPSGRGRPSIPPEVIASVIVLQTLHGLSDREAADAVTFDPAVEGSVWVRDRRRWVPSHDADVLATPTGGQRPAAPDLRKQSET